jgi:hypothetical protein
MFEAEAEGFRRAGIQIGASSTKDAESLMEEALAPYNIARRNNALEMARLYAVLFCFENEIRDFIRDALEEKEGVDWQDKLPAKIKAFAEGRRETAIKDSWLEGEKTDLLGFHRLRSPRATHHRQVGALQGHCALAALAKAANGRAREGSEFYRPQPDATTERVPADLHVRGRLE